MPDQQKQDNQYILTEQGDLGLGAQQLSDEEQKKVNEQQAQQRK
jgi:hypothetical protein